MKVYCVYSIQSWSGREFLKEIFETDTKAKQYIQEELKKLNIVPVSEDYGLFFKLEERDVK